jgi:hypothetical protein
MSTSQDRNDQQVRTRCRPWQRYTQPIRFQKPEQWKYNDPYQYPIPRGTEDPWETLLEPLLAKDQVQCDAWKDEVQNLLIFVGIREFNFYRPG